MQMLRMRIWMLKLMTTDDECISIHKSASRARKRNIYKNIQSICLLTLSTAANASTSMSSSRR